MNQDPKDFKIGLIVIAVAVIASVLAAGTYGFSYGTRLAALGCIVLFLATRSGVFPRIIAVILMPMVLLVKLLPKNLKQKIRKITSDESTKQ